MRWEFKRKKKIGTKKYELPENEPVYKNPLFPKEEIRVLTTFRKIFYLLILLLISGITFYFLYFSIIFEIKEIDIEGNTFIDSENIEEIINGVIARKRFLVFNQSNIFVFSVKQAKSDLSNKIQEKQALESLEIQKIYPDILKVSVNERIPRLVLLTDGRRFLIDLEGIITRDINPEEEFGEEFPRVTYQTKEVLSIGDSTISFQHVEKFFEIDAKLKEATNSIKIGSFSVPDKDDPQIWVKTDKDWFIYFDSQSDIDLQIEKLLLVFKKKEINQDRLDYIDVRFPERVFISPPLE